VDLGSYIYGLSIANGKLPTEKQAELYKFIGIDSWTLNDGKYFIIVPELISVFLLVVTIAVNKTIPY